MSDVLKASVEELETVEQLGEKRTLAFIKTLQLPFREGARGPLDDGAGDGNGEDAAADANDDNVEH